MFRFVILGVLLSSALNVYASWKYIPTEELVQNSDLIVVGTLRHITEKECCRISDNLLAWMTVEATGTICIDSVIWGPPVESVKLVWSYMRSFSTQISHKHLENRNVIWLLNRTGNGVYSANYPGRTVSVKCKDVIEQALSEYPCRIHVPGPYYFNNPVNAFLIIRNPSFEEIAVPGIRYENGILTKSPAVHLCMSSNRGAREERILPFPGHIVEDGNLKPVSIPSRDELRIPIDLDQIYPLKHRDSYKVWFAVDGYGMLNEKTIYLKKARKEKLKKSLFMKRLGLYFYKRPLNQQPETEFGPKVIKYYFSPQGFYDFGY